MVAPCSGDVQASQEIVMAVPHLPGTFPPVPSRDCHSRNRAMGRANQYCSHFVNERNRGPGNLN